MQQSLPGISCYEKFIDNPPSYEYKTVNIGDVRKKTFETFENTTSTFNNVIETVSTINADLANDLRTSRKNINHLINLLVEINDIGKVELSNITKDLSNKIVYIYDNLVTHINQQRSENLKLEIELAKATKEKNEIRHEVEILTETIRKLEVALGVQPDPAFETMMLLSGK